MSSPVTATYSGLIRPRINARLGIIGTCMPYHRGQGCDIDSSSMQ